MPEKILFAIPAVVFSYVMVNSFYNDMDRKYDRLYDKVKNVLQENNCQIRKEIEQNNYQIRKEIEQNNNRFNNDFRDDSEKKMDRFIDKIKHEIVMGRLK